MKHSAVVVLQFPGVPAPKKSRKRPPMSSLSLAEAKHFYPEEFALPERGVYRIDRPTFFTNRDLPGIVAARFINDQGREIGGIWISREFAEGDPVEMADRAAFAAYEQLNTTTTPKLRVLK